MSRTVAQVIVDGIAQLGVRQVFGVVGDALNPLTDAIRHEDDLDGWAAGTRRPPPSPPAPSPS